MKKTLIILVACIVVALSGVIVFNYYSFLFAKVVVGEVIKVERVNTAEAILMGSRNVPEQQLFSFAVAIKDSKGEIHVASSEDRQWAVVQAGHCVEARFFPYEPWQLEKAGTYHGARLERLFDCHRTK